MTQISAKVIADNKNEFDNRITTMVVTFPRFILAELNTHRVFSRNSASSRAIPFEKMVKSVQENPFIPIAWMKDHKGMQGTEYLFEHDESVAINNWLRARDLAVIQAQVLNGGGFVTKQLCNRLLEPFMWHTVIITSTEWENFFALRCPQYDLFSENMPMSFRSKKDLLKYVKEVEADEFKNQYDSMTDLDWLKLNKGQAEIHMMALAEAMWDAMNESTPKELKAYEWHIPFGDQMDNDKMNLLMLNHPLEEGEQITRDELKVKIATARCARVSYTVVGEDKIPSIEKDIELHDKFLQQKPFHASPFEHCARAMDDIEAGLSGATNTNDGWSRNFKGFVQYRAIVEQTIK